MPSFVLILSGLGALGSAYLMGYLRGEVSERMAAKRAMDAEPFPEPDPADIADEEEEEEDACLRVGMRVVCRLSELSHTHGTIIGFAMSATPGGPMLAVVDVKAEHPMPIDVDMVEPIGHGPPPSYRENANPNKQWN